MMSKKFACCEKCFDLLGKKSPPSARLWLDLCALRLNQGPVISLKTQDFPELRILEQMNYITTTEHPKEILVKVHGYQKDIEGLDFFCLGGEHE